MDLHQKRQRLRDWMHEKFSLDPEGRIMLPGPGMTRKIRNDAQWIGFELDDLQLEQILEDTMETYLMVHRARCPSPDGFPQ